LDGGLYLLRFIYVIKTTDNKKKSYTGSGKEKNFSIAAGNLILRPVPHIIETEGKTAIEN